MTLTREEGWRAMMKQLVALDEFLCNIDEEVWVERVVNARQALIKIADGEDFGFEPLAWLSFFERTKNVDDKFRELMTSESSVPRFRRLRELAEAAVAKDPGLIHPDRFKRRNEFMKERIRAYVKERNELPMKNELDEWTALWESMNSDGKNS